MHKIFFCRCMQKHFLLWYSLSLSLSICVCMCVFSACMIGNIMFCITYQCIPILLHHCVFFYFRDFNAIYWNYLFIKFNKNILITLIVPVLLYKQTTCYNVMFATFKLISMKVLFFMCASLCAIGPYELITIGL